jgi:hypothetical protein
MYNIVFMRYMVERKKVLLEKVDTLGNIADSLTKSVSVLKLSWCREVIGHSYPILVNRSSNYLVLAKKTTIGRMLGCYIIYIERTINE